MRHDLFLQMSFLLQGSLYKGSVKECIFMIMIDWTLAILFDPFDYSSVNSHQYTKKKQTCFQDI